MASFKPALETHSVPSPSDRARKRLKTQDPSRVPTTMLDRRLLEMPRVNKGIIQGGKGNVFGSQAVGETAVATSHGVHGSTPSSVDTQQVARLLDDMLDQIERHAAELGEVDRARQAASSLPKEATLPLPHSGVWPSQ